MLMKNIVKSILSFMIVAAFVVACAPKTENAAQTETPAADETEMAVPADSVDQPVEQPVDSASVN
jgi:hypothetical protein